MRHVAELLDAPADLDLEEIVGGEEWRGVGRVVGQGHDPDPGLAIGIDAGTHLPRVGVEDLFLQRPVTRTRGSGNHRVHGIDDVGETARIEGKAHAQPATAMGGTAHPCRPALPAETAESTDPELERRSQATRAPACMQRAMVVQ